MRLPDFRLERYFARYEFCAPFLLCCSDCESMTVSELLDYGGTEAREGFLGLGLGYTESQGNPGLRVAIAGLHQRIKPEQVLVTAGAEEAIFLFMNAALEPGDHVIVQYPCYQSLEEIAAAAGCRITRWAMKEADGGWVLDADELNNLIQPDTRCLVINSPHNPTGHVIPAADLERVLKIARSHGLLIFSDEVYRDLAYQGDAVPASASDLYENAVSLGVMSKSYGLAGLRIGWVTAANEKVYRAMAAMKDYTSICSSAPSEFLAQLAINHREQIFGRNLDIIQANLILLDDFFTKHDRIFTWPRPSAGPIAFPALKGNHDAADFCDRLVTETGVLLLPSGCYDYGTRHFRIGFGRRNMPEALRILDDWLTSRHR